MEAGHLDGSILTREQGTIVRNQSSTDIKALQLYICLVDLCDKISFGDRLPIKPRQRKHTYSLQTSHLRELLLHAIWAFFADCSDADNVLIVLYRQKVTV